MSLQVISLNQQQQYQLNQSTTRKISSSPVNNSPARRQVLSPDLAQLNSLNSKNKKKSSSEDVYQRPLAANVSLMKMILDRLFGQDFALDNSQFNYDKISAEIQSSNSSFYQAIQMNTQADLNVQSMTNEQPVLVTERVVEQQSLSYQMQAQLSIDKQEISIEYQLDLSSNYTRINSFKSSAAALKDPLIIQFGNQSLGNIKEKVQFDVNNDSQMNSLPVFSGDVGYLVFDKNNNQKVDNGSELFGPNTGNGFAELATLDSNNNGFFDPQDQNFQQVFIWQPSTKSREDNNLISLSQAGITAIYLTPINTPFNFRDNNGEVSAQLRQSSFAIKENKQALGVHQLDLQI